MGRRAHCSRCDAALSHREFSAALSNGRGTTSVARPMGSLVKKRRKRMRKKKHRKMLKRTRFQRRARGK